MLKRVINILSTLIGLMGILHIALTPATYGEFTIDALWFAGAGFSLVLLSFLQLVLVNGEERPLFYWLGHLGNGFAVIFIAVILFIVTAPHILFLFLLLLTQFILFMVHHYKWKIN